MKSKMLVEQALFPPTHADLRIQWQERLVRGQPQRQYLLTYHDVAIRQMVVVTGYTLHLPAAPALDRVVQYECLHTTGAQSLLLADPLRRVQVELAPIDILTLQEAIQDNLFPVETNPETRGRNRPGTCSCRHGVSAAFVDISSGFRTSVRFTMDRIPARPPSGQGSRGTAPPLRSPARWPAAGGARSGPPPPSARRGSG